MASVQTEAADTLLRPLVLVIPAISRDRPPYLQLHRLDNAAFLPGHRSAKPGPGAIRALLPASGYSSQAEGSPAGPQRGIRREPRFRR
jgi:hypothetical protein